MLSNFLEFPNNTEPEGVRISFLTGSVIPRCSTVSFKGSEISRKSPASWTTFSMQDTNRPFKEKVTEEVRKVDVPSKGKKR